MAVAAAILFMLMFAASVKATTEHCPSGGVKVESQVDGDLDLIVPAAGTLVCVKGSTDATGIVIADGETTLVDILDNGHNVSYYVTYDGQETAPPTEPPATEPPATEPPATEPPATEEPTETPICAIPEGCLTPEPKPSQPDTATSEATAAPTGPQSNLLLIAVLIAWATMLTMLPTRERNRR